MSGLPSGQFVDYLIIGAITSVCGAILDRLLKSMDGKKRLRITAILILIFVAGVAAFLRTRSLQQAETNAQAKNNPNPSVSPAPTPSASPAVSLPEQSPPIPRHEPELESAQDAFTRTHVAPPAKGQRRSGQWAVIISDPKNHESYPKLGNLVSAVIAQAGQSSVAIFRPSAAQGAGFDTLFAADPVLSRRLHEFCDSLVIGKITSTVQDNPIAPNMLKFTLMVDIKIISTDSGEVRHEIQTSAFGAGYSHEEARSNAEENLASALRAELKNAIR